MFFSAHLQLLEKVNILHRDVSLANIMIGREKKSDPINHAVTSDIRKGLLIDLDCAEEKVPGAKHVVNPGHRIGTKPYMAWQILTNEGCEHSTIHDLESFYYVLLYICIMYAGPDHKPKPGNPPSFMHDFIYSNSATVVGMVKFGMLHQTNEGFRLMVLDNFPPYFDDLKECINELRLLLAPKVTKGAEDSGKYKVTHQQMIDILLRYADTTSESESETEEEIESQPSSPTPAPGSIKRKFQVDDTVVDDDIIYDYEYEYRVIKRRFVSENLHEGARHLKTVDTNLRMGPSRVNRVEEGEEC